MASTLPITFSAPDDGYQASVIDALQLGVYLLLMADDTNRKRYSMDPENAAAGVRIVQSKDAIHSQDGMIIVPQQIVGVDLPRSEIRADRTAGAGTIIVRVLVSFLRHYRPRYVGESETNTDRDMDEPSIASELAHIVGIFERGTLYLEDMETADGKVVDPMRTALAEDGTYDTATPIYTLNENPPSISIQQADFLSRDPKRSVEKIWRDAQDNAQEEAPIIAFAKYIGVAYGVVAEYEVIVPDLGDLTRGGMA